jgi:hypothetical protein
LLAQGFVRPTAELFPVKRRRRYALPAHSPSRYPITRDLRTSDRFWSAPLLRRFSSARRSNIAYLQLNSPRFSKRDRAPALQSLRRIRRQERAEASISITAVALVRIGTNQTDILGKPD